MEDLVSEGSEIDVELYERDEESMEKLSSFYDFNDLKFILAFFILVFSVFTSISLDKEARHTAIYLYANISDKSSSFKPKLVTTITLSKPSRTRVHYKLIPIRRNGDIALSIPIVGDLTTELMYGDDLVFEKKIEYDTNYFTFDAGKKEGKPLIEKKQWFRKADLITFVSDFDNSCFILDSLLFIVSTSSDKSFYLKLSFRLFSAFLLGYLVICHIKSGLRLGLPCLGYVPFVLAVHPLEFLIRRSAFLSIMLSSILSLSAQIFLIVEFNITTSRSGIISKNALFIVVVLCLGSLVDGVDLYMHSKLEMNFFVPLGTGVLTNKKYSSGVFSLISFVIGSITSLMSALKDHQLVIKYQIVLLVMSLSSSILISFISRTINALPMANISKTVGPTLEILNYLIWTFIISLRTSNAGDDYKMEPIKQGDSTAFALEHDTD